MTELNLLLTPAKLSKILENTQIDVNVVTTLRQQHNIHVNHIWLN